MAASEGKEEKGGDECECVGWITASDLPRLKGQMVTIVARNTSPHEDEEAEFTFVDGSGTQFKVLVPKANFPGYEQGTVVEITGRVLTNDTILQIKYHDWGMKANLQLWDKLVDYTRKFGALF